MFLLPLQEKVWIDYMSTVEMFTLLKLFICCLKREFTLLLLLQLFSGVKNEGGVCAKQNNFYVSTKTLLHIKDLCNLWSFVLIGWPRKVTNNISEKQLFNWARKLILSKYWLVYMLNEGTNNAALFWAIQCSVCKRKCYARVKCQKKCLFSFNQSNLFAF